MELFGTALQIVMLSVECDHKKIYEIYMDIFHILTLTIAIIIFSILFIYTAVQMSKQKTLYAPIISNCPDLWVPDSSGNCIIPQDSKSNIGTLTSKPLYLYNGKENENNDFTSSSMTYGYSFLPQIHLNGITYKGTDINQNGYFSYDIPYGFDQAYPTKINFNDPMWGSKGDPNCAIKLWAAQNNITWDGISNYSC